MTDYGPLLYPPKEPPAPVMTAIDALSWALPALAALLSVLGGLAALNKADASAAILSIAAGVIGAAGVIFTNWASRVRDGRLRVTHGVADLAFDTAADVDRRNPGPQI
jgi:hypothetical protein